MHNLVVGCARLSIATLAYVGREKIAPKYKFAPVGRLPLLMALASNISGSPDGEVYLIYWDAGRFWWRVGVQLKASSRNNAPICEVICN